MERVLAKERGRILKAFPLSFQDMDGEVRAEAGMDLRDYFAIKIATVIITNEPLRAAISQMVETELCNKAIAASAYNFADEMMQVRKLKHD